MFEKYNPSLVILGADSIYSQGGVINKTGSYLLSMIAKENGVPVIIGATAKKVMVKDIEVLGEIKPSNDTDLWREQVPPNLEIIDSHFEKVPHSLISGYITEKGFNKIPKGERYLLSKEIIGEVYS